MWYRKAPVSSGDGLTFTHRGDPAAWDKSVGDFTFDGTLRLLDLSAIVPADAQLIVMRLNAQADGAGRLFAVCSPANTNLYNMTGALTPNTTVTAEAQVTVPCNAGREVKYYGPSQGFTTIGLLVMGWWS